jgi:hypothetical protein
MAKMTGKNQLTLPKTVVEVLGHPSHFRIQVHDGVLLLWPARLVCAADATGAAGDPQDTSVKPQNKGI